MTARHRKHENHDNKARAHSILLGRPGALFATCVALGCSATGSPRGGTAGASAGAGGTAGTAGTAGSGGAGTGGMGGSAGAGAGGAAGTAGGGAGAAGVPNLPDLHLTQFQIYSPGTLSTDGVVTGLRMCLQIASPMEGFIKGRNSGVAGVQSFELGYGFALSDKTSPKYCVHTVADLVAPQTDFEARPVVETCCVLEGVPGTYYVVAAADPNGLVAEAVEDNNVLYSDMTFTVTAEPNPAQPMTGQADE